MERWRRYAFPAVWMLSAVGLGWRFAQGRHAFDSPATLPALLALLACTAALLAWLGPLPAAPPAGPERTRRGRLALAVVLECLKLPLAVVVQAHRGKETMEPPALPIPQVEEVVLVPQGVGQRAVLALTSQLMSAQPME